MTKIHVAAICRDESKHIIKWLEHVKHADTITLVDTGSEDDTQELALDWAVDNGVTLDLMVDSDPYRNLGRSRNMAHMFVPEDEYVVWLDLDEHFTDDNWVELLRSHIEASPNKLDSVMIMMNNGDSRYYQMKCYRKGSYEWKYSAHEVLVAGFEIANMLRIEHTDHGAPFETIHAPDMTKPRSYLKELASDFRTNPNDHRVMFYYARELCYHVQYKDASASLDIAASLCELLTNTGAWRDYVAHLNMELASAYYAKAEDDKSRDAAVAAIAARPDRIETYAMAASVSEYLGDTHLAIGFALRGLRLEHPTKPLLFEGVASNLLLCLEILVRSCIKMEDYERAAFYAATLANRSGQNPEDVLNEYGILEKLTFTSGDNHGESNASVESADTV